jgi:hypothetical protein
MGTGSFPGVKRLGPVDDHSPPSRAKVLEELSYISTPLWATTGPVMGLLYLYLLLSLRIYVTQYFMFCFVCLFVFFLVGWGGGFDEVGTRRISAVAYMKYVYNILVLISMYVPCILFSLLSRPINAQH